LQNNGLTGDKLQIALIALKQEKIIEVYARKSNSEKYSLLVTYPICASSGKPGPKRKEGDLQVPEGFYYINHFNPESNFHLSLGINYPNKNDRKKSTATNPGGSIYIHGNCVTIGCLPITDAKIEELYLLALYAADAGQKQIPVYIFPFRMNETNMVTYRNKYASNKQLLDFWANLKTGYQLFFERYTEVAAGCNSNGDYTF
jgi:murein L,D-transpeptidase YafK